MIVGLGIDVVEIDRFAAALERAPALRTRLFTPAEQVLHVASLAARFAVKEALAKALGAPGGMHWTDAEVFTDDSGRPYCAEVKTGKVVWKRGAEEGEGRG